MVPELRRVVVAHALDQLEAGAWHELCGAPAAALVDQGVLVTVHDERWHRHRTQTVSPRAGPTDRFELSGRTLGVEAAVEGPLSIVPPPLLVGVGRAAPDPQAGNAPGHRALAVVG